MIYSRARMKLVYRLHNCACTGILITHVFIGPVAWAQEGTDVRLCASRTEYTVRAIDNEGIIELDNGDRVTLLGISYQPEYMTQARDYLSTLCYGRRVFYEVDHLRGQKGPVRSSIIPAYLYLDDCTFVNKAVIRQGIAYVDKGQAFAFRDLFLECEKNARESGVGHWAKNQ